MTEKRISLGINVSILLILMIFGVLLSLPLKLLLDTSFEAREQENDNQSATTESSKEPPSPEESNDAKDGEEISALSIDFRKIKRCRNYRYVDCMKSILYSDYDENCTYVSQLRVSIGDHRKDDESTDLDGEKEPRESRNIAGENSTQELDDNDEEEEEEEEDEEAIQKARRMKSIPVAGHILVTMLLISAIAALIEVLRIRFCKDKNKDSYGGGSVTSRKSSIIDLPVQRRFVPREPMKSQRSFEMQGMHRSPLRLLGARPPPLIRRSSFPTQHAKQSLASVSGTPNVRMSRRQSAESDEEIGLLISALHHRTRLIRRH